MNFFDAQTVWLNVMNLLLGLFTLFLLGMIVGSILLSLHDRTEVKTRKLLASIASSIFLSLRYLTTLKPH